MTFSVLPVPQSNMSAEYKASYKCIGVPYDKTKAVALLDLQYRACHHANGQDKCAISMLTSPICQNNQAIKEECSYLISHMPCTYIPIAFTSNLMIILSKP